MIKVQKQQNVATTAQNISSIRQTTSDAPVAIRSATASELTKYEKSKLAGIEDKAQQNKIEAIRLNGTRIKPDSNTKTVNINVGDLAFKSVVTPNELSSNELFFIRCSLD
jgi:hypothetical protein